MSFVFVFLRFFPFFTIPVILILVEVCIQLARRKKHGKVLLSLLVMSILIAGNVLFFQKGGFVEFLPWLKSELDFLIHGPPEGFYPQ